MIKKEELANLIISEFLGKKELLDVIKFLDKSKAENSPELIAEILSDVKDKTLAFQLIEIINNANLETSSDKKRNNKSKNNFIYRDNKINVVKKKKNTIKKNSHKEKGNAKRAVRENEYQLIVKSIKEGFSCEIDGERIVLLPNERVAMALNIEANTGLRVSDIVKLKVKDLSNGILVIREKKTNKLQNRKLNPILVEAVRDYAVRNYLREDDLLIGLKERNIQKTLAKACRYLGYEGIGTHSFRKYFSNKIYSQTKDARLVQALLNHSSLSSTQRYLGVTDDELDQASVNFETVIY